MRTARAMLHFLVVLCAHNRRAARLLQYRQRMHARLLAQLLTWSKNIRLGTLSLNNEVTRELSELFVLLLQVILAGSGEPDVDFLQRVVEELVQQLGLRNFEFIYEVLLPVIDHVRLRCDVVCLQRSLQPDANGLELLREQQNALRG